MTPARDALAIETTLDPWLGPNVVRLVGHLLLSLVSGGGSTGFERSATVRIVDRRTGHRRHAIGVDHAVHLADLRARLESDLDRLSEDEFVTAWGLRGVRPAPSRPTWR